jgi:hypothetical protein
MLVMPKTRATIVHRRLDLLSVAGQDGVGAYWDQAH